MAPKPSCWEGVLGHLACAQQSKFGLRCAFLENFIALLAPITVLEAAGERLPGPTSPVLRE